MSEQTPFRALIAGAGVAGLEAAFALKDIAGDAVETVLLSPDDELVYRPMSVREPFSYAAAHRYPLEQIVSDAGARLVHDRLSSVDINGQAVSTASGDTLAYDALLLAVGARRHPAFRHGLTLDDAHLDDAFHGLLQDVEMGYVRGIAFVMPSDNGWPLPAYELALMTAERAFAMCVDLHITIVTPERAPLSVFGDQASAAVSEQLAQRGIAVETNASSYAASDREVVIYPGTRKVQVDRIIGLPLLRGPAIPGLRDANDGFVPIDKYCRVVGTERIFAAGDATDYPVKHGGLSTQQADTAALGIAHLAGIGPEPKPFRPEIRGMLLTGRAPLYIKARVIGAFGFHSEVSTTPLWSPPTKISARYLAPYLDDRDREAAPGRPQA